MMKVIFTHLKPEIWQYKTALALKTKGVKTISVSLKAFDRKLFNRAFDEIISLNLPDLKPKSIVTAALKHPLKFLKFFYKLLTIKSDAAICQGAPHYLTAFFIWLFKGRMKRIYFPYDFNFSILKNPRDYYPRREVWGEEYSFKNCDGVICKGGFGELGLLPKRFEIKSRPKICFSCYTLDEWFVKYDPKKKLSYKNLEIHAVYVGSVFDSPLMEPLTLEFSGILKEGIHLHIYGLPSHLNNNLISKITQNKKELERYLHAHDFFSPEKLPEEISKYDYGIFPGEFKKEITIEVMKYVTGNKLASYLEASIPTIVGEKNLYNSLLVKENYLGISAKKGDSLKKHISRFNYSKSIRNIAEFRKKYSVENHIPELINFIESLKSKKYEVYAGMK